MTHICISKLTIIGSDNSLSPRWCQAIIWTNAGVLLIRTLGTNFSEILSDLSSAERRPSERDTGTMCKYRCFLSSFIDALCRVRNKIMYALSWRTVSPLTRVLFLYLFPSLLLNSGNRHNKTPHEHWNSSSLEYIHYSLSRPMLSQALYALFW